MTLTIGSLFAGIGGLELGLERAGLGPVRWQVEIDERCRRVLARHWPDAERFADVRAVGARTLAPVDVVCGGFPCQDISLAGANRGLEGERSGLWYEYQRIIAEIRPRFVVVENVSGLVRRGLDTVLEGLWSLGYAVEGTRMRASDLGAPHRRERLFLIAHTDGELVRLESERGEPDASERGNALALDASGAGRVAGRVHRPWAPEPRICRVAHGIPERVERLRALGNAVVPACASVVGARVMAIARGA